MFSEEDWSTSKEVDGADNDQFGSMVDSLFAVVEEKSANEEIDQNELKEHDDEGSAEIDEVEEEAEEEYPGDAEIGCQMGATRGGEYRGEASRTAGGRRCQGWGVKSPHQHAWDAMGDHSYCR